MLSKLLKLKILAVNLKEGRTECSCSECQPVSHWGVPDGRDWKVTAWEILWVQPNLKQVESPCVASPTGWWEERTSCGQILVALASRQRPIMRENTWIRNKFDVFYSAWNICSNIGGSLFSSWWAYEDTKFSGSRSLLCSGVTFDSLHLVHSFLARGRL